MNNVTIGTDLFGVRFARLHNPITNEPVVINLPGRPNTDHSYIDRKRIELLRAVIVNLRALQRESISNHTWVATYSKERNVRRVKEMMKLNQEADLLIEKYDLITSWPEACSFTYEHLYPLLAQFPANKAIYIKLLHYIENHCVRYSKEHQLIS